MTRPRATLALAVGFAASLLAGCRSQQAPPAATVTAPLTSARVPAQRDPLLWPFASDSIWNMPRGAAATTRPAQLTPPHVDLDVDYLVVTSATDPLTPTYDYATFGPGRCRGAKPQPQGAFDPVLGLPIHVPSSFVLPDATSKPYATPNNSSAFLDPDGHTLHQFNATARCRAGAPLFGYRTVDGDIHGDGRLGGHLGSGLSSIGGDVRAGELFGAQPLDHALKVDVTPAALSYDPSSPTPGFRWPADLADGYAAKEYSGRDPQLVMGSLLTVPQDVTPASLGLRTEAGRRLLDAFRSYGAYVADTTGDADASLCVDSGMLADFRARTGRDLADDPALQSDLQHLFRALVVVTDDGPTAVGGPGARLAPLAPPLAGS